MSKLNSVLIVDDSERCIELLSLAFRSSGAADVRSETNPEAARDRILSEDIDLVMLDIKMPGLSGFQILSAVRAAGVNTPVLMCSGSIRESDIDQAYSAGCNGYFGKPSSLDGYRELASTVFGYWARGEVPGRA